MRLERELQSDEEMKLTSCDEEKVVSTRSNPTRDETCILVIGRDKYD
jgi:hypothetical protein